MLNVEFQMVLNLKFILLDFVKVVVFSNFSRIQFNIQH